MITGLSIEQLAVARGERTLFEGFNLTLKAGEAVALVGANGAGKTSLLRVIAGFLRPAAGVVRFEGAAGALDADEARRGGLHFLSHQDGLKATRTARQEFFFQAEWTGGADMIPHAIDVLDLEHLLDLEVRVLSAGQRRRLALARLIASPRSVWLLDEPMAPLDEARRAMFGEIMESHLGNGGLILAAVHDPLPLPTRTVEIGA